MTIGERIRLIREQKEMSLEDVAKICGTSRQAIYKYENNIVYVKLLGACKDCSFIDVTLKDGIEEIIISEIPEVKEVINIDSITE